MTIQYTYGVEQTSPNSNDYWLKVFKSDGVHTHGTSVRLPEEEIPNFVQFITDVFGKEN